jgi:hypothetical protein
VLASLAAAVASAPAAAAPAGSAAKPASASYAGRVGLNGHLIWQSEGAARPQLDRARAAGVDWIREELPWASVEPSKGAFSWSRTDGLMAAAAAAKVNVLGLLGYSAPWASSDPSGKGDTRYPPREAGDYASYALEVVKRYGRKGSFWAARPDLTPRPLTAVELWNEPWGYWAWKPNPDPAAYARLVHAAASAIRAYDPSIRILIAGNVLQVRTDGALRNWMQEVRNADPGLSALFDAYSIHPYPYPRTKGPYDDSGDARWGFRQVTLNHELDSSKPVWITEIGWSTAPAAGDAVSEQTQATYVKGALQRGLEDWGSFVERVFLYSWDLDNGPAGYREGYYGLRHADGSTKPAWDAVTRLISNGRTTPLAQSAVGVRAFLSLGGNRSSKAKTPRWFWRWANWHLGLGPYQGLGRANARHRPAGIPHRVPGWAWRRLSRGPLGQISVRGVVDIPSGASPTSGRVVVLARMGGLWRSIGQHRSTGGPFRLTARPRRWRELSAVRVTFENDTARAFSAVVPLKPR